MTGALSRRRARALAGFTDQSRTGCRENKAAAPTFGLYFDQVSGAVGFKLVPAKTVAAYHAQGAEAACR